MWHFFCFSLCGRFFKNFINGQPGVAEVPLMSAFYYNIGREMTTTALNTQEAESFLYFLHRLDCKTFCDGSRKRNFSSIFSSHSILVIFFFLFLSFFLSPFFVFCFFFAKTELYFTPAIFRTFFYPNFPLALSSLL